MRASKCLMLAFFFKWSLKGTPFSFLFVPRTSFRGFFSLLRALSEKNDLGQFLHVSCLFWSSSFSFLFVPRTSFRGFFSLLRASLEKNDLGQFLHVSCLFWSSSFGIKNILLEAHTWSNKRFLMSERRI